MRRLRHDNFIFSHVFREEEWKLNPAVHEEVLEEIQEFETNYLEDGPDHILGRFDFKRIHQEHGKYDLYQVRLTKNFRGILMFLEAARDVHWLYLFKKTGQRNQKKIEYAVQRAPSYYDELEARRTQGEKDAASGERPGSQ